MTTKSTKTRPLPQNRNQSLEYEFGTVEPSFIPVGKASMKQVMDFVTQHQAQPESYTAKDIALEYNLELVHVQQVLKYFQNYQMYLPKELLKKHPKLLDNLSSQKLNLNEAKKLLGVYTPADEGKS